MGKAEIIHAFHNRLHSIISPLDHSSTATPERILKADPNGLPVEATNTDAEVAAAVAAGHARQHDIIDPLDHTSGATPGQVLQANANGLPVDATNTDAEVADAVAKRHTQGTDTALGAVGVKNPPINADKVLYRNSAAADALVTSTWTQVKAFLKTYFDTVYDPIGSAAAALAAALAALAAHVAITAAGIHGSSVAAAINTLIHRDAAGRSQIVDPAVAADIDNLGARNAAIAAYARQKLTANRTYYVRIDGNDGNDGLSDAPGGAFLTISHAVDVVSSLDICGYTVTIQVKDGTYSESVGLRSVTGYAAPGNLVIQGNNGTPANVIIDANTGTCFSASYLNVCWDIKDLTVKAAAGGNGRGLYARGGGSVIRYSNLIFDGCSEANLYATFGGILSCTGNYSINAAGRYHIYSIQGTVEEAVRTVTFSANMNFWGGFARAERLGLISSYLVTYVFGIFAVTGKRYDATGNSVICTFGGGANYFPGNIAGTTGTGGQYL